MTDLLAALTVTVSIVNALMLLGAVYFFFFAE
jgi:hypothetical protein